MKKSTLTPLLTLLALTLSAPALAQDVDGIIGTDETPNPDAPTISVMVGPLSALNGMARFYGDFALAPRWSLEADVGAGTNFVNQRSTDQEIFTARGGVMLKRYLVGDFDRGLFLGLGTRYIRRFGEEGEIGFLEEADELGLGVGTLATHEAGLLMNTGTKLISQNGFTFQALVGLGAGAQFTDDAARDVDTSTVRPVLQVNAALQLGYSF